MKENKKGYSLIELLVSITIILVLAGIGVTSFSNLSKTKKIITVKNELSSLIKLSRNLAITRQLPDGSLGLDYIQVALSGRNLTVKGLSGGVSDVFFNKSIDGDMNGVGVTVTSNLATFGFERGTGRLVNGAGAFINGQLIITLKYGGVTDTITINDLGIINEE